MNPCGLINSFWLLIEALISLSVAVQRDGLKAHPSSALCHILEVISVQNGLMSL